MDSKKVSIIVMVYKNLEQVEKTLDSIFVQNYKNYEVLVSDDGSPDYFQEDFDILYEKYKDFFMKLIVIKNEKNVGTVKHFNKLIKKSNGSIICPLSSGDCFYDENSLKYIVNAFESQKEILVFTSKRIIKKKQQEYSLPTDYQIKLLKNTKELYRYSLKYGNFISGASTYYSKEVFKKYGLFDEKYALLEDYPYFMNLCLDNENIGFIDHPTIQYDLGGISTSHNRNPLLDRDYITLFQKCLKNENIKLSLITKRALRYRIDKIEKKYNFFIVNLLYIDVVLVLFYHKLFLK